MGLFGKKLHDIIEVQFFDLATGKIFAQSKMPIGQLPQSFEASTRLHLANEDWSVVEARPMTAAEFGRTGKLALILSKITEGFIDPSTILFSLPTIANDALPAIAPGSSRLGVEIIEIHEDDWRQIEWLPESASDIVESELSLIDGIFANERKGVGFAKCHLRKSVPTLSDGPPISMREFRALLPSNAAWLSGFGYRDVAGIVNQSFAVRLLSSIELFGTELNGLVNSVCFANTRGNNASELDVSSLADFALKQELLLVDWCRSVAIRPSLSDYMGYFTRG